MQLGPNTFEFGKNESLLMVAYTILSWLVFLSLFSGLCTIIFYFILDTLVLSFLSTGRYVRYS